MQKLDNLSAWEPLPQKKTIELPEGPERKFRIYTNSPANTRVYAQMPDDGEIRFLASVSGVDCIEFHAIGGIKLTTPDPDLWVWSPEFETDFTVVEDPEIYTTIMERQPRNYELEAMLFLQRQAEEKRWAELEGKVNDHLRRQSPANAPADPASGDEQSGGTPPDPENNGENNGAGS